MDVEAKAKAMFEALHARFNRMRNWDSHPDPDSGAGELGRDSFRAMAAVTEDPGIVPEEPQVLDALDEQVPEKPLTAAEFPANG